MENKIYKCNQTIDLEEMIEMERECNNVRCIAVYNSGREEVFTAKLKKNGVWSNKFSKIVSQLRDFPTVQQVKIEKF